MIRRIGKIAVILFVALAVLTIMPRSVRWFFAIILLVCACHKVQKFGDKNREITDVDKKTDVTPLRNLLE